jgi:hypothetical protein
VPVELSIVVVWVVFPIGLACIASGRIGRALAQLREGLVPEEPVRPARDLATTRSGPS